jgi:hypothetical protein
MPVESRNEREIARRVAEARRLLDEPLLNEALDSMEAAAIEDMLKVPFWAARRMRMAADRVKVVRGMRRHLEKIIVNGELVARPAKRLA